MAVVRFAATGDPLAGHYVKAVTDDERRMSPEAKRRQAAAEAALRIAKARTTHRPVSPTVSIRGQAPSVPMPEQTRTVKCEPYKVLRSDADGKALRDKNGKALYRRDLTFTPGSTIVRRWSKKPRTSQTQIYRGAPFKRRTVDGRTVVEAGSVHRVGNVPSTLVPERYRATMGLMGH